MKRKARTRLVARLVWGAVLRPRLPLHPCSGGMPGKCGVSHLVPVRFLVKGHRVLGGLFFLKLSFKDNCLLT